MLPMWIKYTEDVREDPDVSPLVSVSFAQLRTALYPEIPLKVTSIQGAL